MHIWNSRTFLKVFVQSAGPQRFHVRICLPFHNVFMGSFPDQHVKPLSNRQIFKNSQYLSPAPPSVFMSSMSSWKRYFVLTSALFFIRLLEKKRVNNWRTSISCKKRINSLQSLIRRPCFLWS